MNKADDIVIVGAARTPMGRFRGALSQVRGDHLGAVVLNGLIERAGVTPVRSMRPFSTTAPR